MGDRPKIKLGLTNTDKIIEFIGWILLIGTWILAILSFSNLPESIPTHLMEREKQMDLEKSLIFLHYQLLERFFLLE